MILEQDSAFDEAVKGVDAVVHTASPVHVSAVDPQGNSGSLSLSKFRSIFRTEMIGPAVKGTVEMLQSALKYGCVTRFTATMRLFHLSFRACRTSIQRVVVTSSCATVFEMLPTPKVFSELDWNEQSIKEVEEQGSNASNLAKYRASKILAERGASHARIYHPTTFPSLLPAI